MNSTENTYFRLTGINLDAERRIWDERGKGYYGEYQVFEKLYSHAPGNYKLLMNLHIPVANRRTTEVDLLMIHETGIYVFEVKHYRGTIYGDSEGEVWTQYFRTAKNNVFKNPIHQNGYHIRALAEFLPNAPIFSAIVFTSEECDLRVQNRNPYLVVTKLNELLQQISPWLNSEKKIYNLEQIDQIFGQLVPYSPISKQKCPTELGTGAPFYEYISLLKHDVDERVKTLEARTKLAEKEASGAKSFWRKRFLVFSVIAAVIAAAICINCMYLCNLRVESAQKELQAMQQNFQHVDAYADEYLQLIDGMIQVSDIQLEMSPDLQNTAIFSCGLKNCAEEYGIMFMKDTKYIIMFNDGTVQEYDMFGDRLTYSYSGQRIGGTNHSNWYRSSCTLLPLEIYGVQSLEEISYIKLANISLWKYGVNSNNSLKNGLELEIYSASQN